MLTNLKVNLRVYTRNHESLAKQGPGYPHRSQPGGADCQNVRIVSEGFHQSALPRPRLPAPTHAARSAPIVSHRVSGGVRTWTGWPLFNSILWLSNHCPITRPDKLHVIGTSFFRFTLK
jgi:hypothetical protein